MNYHKVIARMRERMANHKPIPYEQEKRSKSNSCTNRAEINKKYRQSHEEEIREKARLYYQSHKKEILESRRKNYKAINERKRIYNRRRYCFESEELIENYRQAKADDFHGWLIHHRLITHTSDGAERLVLLTREELQSLNMYFGRPASELIFMKRGDQMRLRHRISAKSKV